MSKITISTKYTPGIGWQYVLRSGNFLLGRFGKFETKGEAQCAGDSHAEDFAL